MCPPTQMGGLLPYFCGCAPGGRLSSRVFSLSFVRDPAHYSGSVTWCFSPPRVWFLCTPRLRPGNIPPWGPPTNFSAPPLLFSSPPVDIPPPGVSLTPRALYPPFPICPRWIPPRCEPAGNPILPPWCGPPPCQGPFQHIPRGLGKCLPNPQFNPPTRNLARCRFPPLALGRAFPPGPTIPGFVSPRRGPWKGLSARPGTSWVSPRQAAYESGEPWA